MADDKGGIFQEFDIILGADTSKANKQLQQLGDTAEKVIKEVGASEDVIQKSANDIEAAAKRANKAFGALYEQVQLTTRKLLEDQTSIGKLPLGKSLAQNLESDFASLRAQFQTFFSDVEQTALVKTSTINSAMRQMFATQKQALAAGGQSIASQMAGISGQYRGTGDLAGQANALMDLLRDAQRLGAAASDIDKIKAKIEQLYGAMQKADMKAFAQQEKELAAATRSWSDALAKLDKSREALGAAVQSAPTKLLATEMERLNLEYRTGVISLEAYRRELMDLMPLTEGVYRDQMKLITALEHPPKTLVAEQALASMKRLETAFRSGQLAEDQYIAKLNALRPALENDEAGMLQLTKAVQRLEMATDGAGRGVTFLGQAFKTAKHHAIWMFSGELLMPLYNLPREVFTVVKELDASFAKLKSQFETKPEFAGNIDLVNSKMQEMTKWSSLFARHFGEDIKDVNEVIYQAAKVYSKTADIVAASNAGMKLSVMDFSNNATESMSKFIAVTQQFGIAPADMDYFINKIIEAGHLVRANSGEVMDALSRNASLLKNAGSDINTSITLMAMSLQKIGVSAETAGTSWKTLIARMGDPKISKILKSIGIDMYDAEMQSKNFGDVLQIMMEKYASLNDAAKNSFLKQVAGIRQGNVLAGILTTNLEQWNHLYKTISASPDVLSTRVGPALQTNLDTVARRLKSLDSVWQAFVYHIMGSESAKALLAKLFGTLIESIDFLDAHSETLIAFAKAIFYIGSAYMAWSTAMKLANDLSLLNINILGTQIVKTGTLTFVTEGATVATGEFTLATKGLSAAMALSLPGIIAVAAALTALMGIKIGTWWENNISKVSVKESVDDVNRGIAFLEAQKDNGDRLAAQIEKRKQDLRDNEAGKGVRGYEKAADQSLLGLRIEINKKIAEDELLLKKVRAVQNKGSKDQIDKDIERLKKSIGPLKARNDEPKNEWDLMGDKYKAEYDKLQKEMSKFGGNPPKGTGSMPEKEKREKGAAGVTDEYRVEVNQLQAHLKALEELNSEYAKNLAQDMKRAENSVKDFYGTMTNMSDVETALLTVHDLFSQIGRQAKSDKSLIGEYQKSIKEITAQNAEIENKLKTSKLTDKEKTALENKKTSNLNAITELKSKVNDLNMAIEKFPDDFDRLIQTVITVAEKGVTDTFNKLNERNELLKKNGQSTAIAWRESYLNALKELVAQSPVIQQALGEGMMKAPTEYLALLDKMIHDMGKTALEQRDAAWAQKLEQLPVKRAEAEKYLNLVRADGLKLTEAITTYESSKISAYEKEIEYRKALAALQGQGNVSVEQQKRDAAFLIAHYTKLGNAYAAAGNMAGWLDMQIKILNTEQAINQTLITQTTAEYDKQLDSVKKYFDWKNVYAREDQKELLAYNQNLQEKAILQQRVAYLASLVPTSIWNADAATQAGNEFYKSWKAANDELTTLNQNLAAQEPIFKRIMEAQNTAFTSMKGNIKQTFTDLLDSSKTFMQSITDAFKRQGEIVKTTIINALTEAMMMKFSGPMGSFADQQGMLTAGIFKLFGLEAPTSAMKPEEVWRKSFDTSKNALRVTSADSGGGMAGSIGGILGGFVSDTVTNALTGGKKGGFNAYNPLGVSAGNTPAAYSSLETMAALGMQYYAQQNPEIAAGPGYNILSQIGGAIWGPVGSMGGALLGAIADNALGVGRGQQRRDVMQAQQEQRSQSIKDIQARYEALGLGTPTLNIPNFVEESKRSNFGLSGTSRWYTAESAAAVQEALDKETMIVAHMEQVAKNLKDSMAEMNHSLAMGSPTFYTSGQTRGQDLTSVLLQKNTSAADMVDQIFGYRGKLWENMNTLSPTVNTLSSTIELLKYHLQELADAGMQAGDDFQQTSEQLMAALQKQYWAGITSPTLIAEKNKFFGVGTDQDTLKAYEDAVNKAFGHTGPVTADLIAYFWNSIKDKWAMVQTGQLTGTAADQITQQEALLEALKNLTDQISSNQLGAAATTGGTNLGEAISGNAQVVQNEIHFEIPVTNMFATKTEMQAIAKEFWLMVKSQGWVDPSVVMI